MGNGTDEIAARRPGKPDRRKQRFRRVSDDLADRLQARLSGRKPRDVAKASNWNQALRVMRDEVATALEMLNEVSATRTYHSKSDLRAVLAKLELAVRWGEEVAE